MIKKALIVALLALSLLIYVPANAQPQGLMVSGVSFGPSSSPIEVEAGSYNVPLFIYLTNMGQFPAINISVRAISTSLFTVISEPQNMSVLPSGATEPFIAYINVSSRAVSGLYRMPIVVSYLQFNGASYVARNFTYIATLPISTFSYLQVYTTYWGNGETLAYPGAVDLPLTIVVRNSGSNTAYNATIVVSVARPFTSESGNSTITQFIGPLPAGASVPIEVYLNINDNATLGYYPINVTLSWNNGIKQAQKIFVPVFGSSQVEVQGYMLNPPQIFPGTQDAEMYIFIVNSGNITASNVNVNVSARSPISIISSSKTTIGLLPPGTPVQLTYLISVNESSSSPASVPLYVQITYGGKSHETILALPISGRASFSVSPSSIAVTQGDSDYYVTYTLYNYGNVTAKDVQAQLMLPNTISGNTFDYLGDISPGSNSTATFSLDVDSNAPTGTYGAVIEVMWQQSNAPGQEFVSRIPVTFTIKESLLNQVVGFLFTPPTVYLTALLIIVIVAAVIAVLVVRGRRASP